MAVKKVTNQVDKSEAYKREIDALRVVDQHRHRHILPLLASYSRLRNGVMEYYLIFPQARCNLMNMWEEHTGPPFDGVIFTWMLSQCHGLVHALFQIHHESKDFAASRLCGRHGKFHPFYILVFADGTEPEDHPGTLVLSDFKNAEFYPQSSSLSEYGIEESGRPSRWWDIWSLGCFLLSFVSWFLGGSGLRKKLQAGFAQAYQEARKNNLSNNLGTGTGRDDSRGPIIRKMVIEVSVCGSSRFPPHPGMLIGR